MKRTTRILSLLLALVMLAGILPSVAPTVAEAAIVHSGVTNINNVIYLSDHGYIASANLNNANGDQTTKDYAWNNPTTPIYIGGVVEEQGDAESLAKAQNVKDTSAFFFKKGLGMQPFNPGTEGYGDTYGAAYTLFDISTLNVDTFHAVVGSSNNASFQAGLNTTGTVFDVYGLSATDSEGVAYTPETALEALQAQMVVGDDVEPLASSGTILGVNTYEFNVDISGVKYLMLVVRCAVNTNNAHAYCNSAWGGACVYDSKMDTGYFPLEDTTAFNAPTGKVTYLAPNTPADVHDFNDAVNTSRGHKLGAVDSALSANTHEATKSVELTPCNPGSSGADSSAWATYDLSEIEGNTFYAAVGIRNNSGKTYGYGEDSSNTNKYPGIIFSVWASDGKDANGNDADADSAEYDLLSSSEVISKTMTGEFWLDVSDVKYLKLMIRLNVEANNAHQSIDSIFGNACVYSRDVIDISEEVVKANVKLQDSLHMMFAVPMTAISDFDGHYAQVTCEEVTENFALTADDVDGDGTNESYVFTYEGIRAKQMTDEISVVICDKYGLPVTSAYTDSIQAYCQRLLAKETTGANLQTVVVDLLNYGAEAQKRFDYKEDTLANDIEGLPAGSATVKEYVDNHTAFDGTDCKYSQTNVALQDNLKMMFKFEGLASGMTAKVTCLDRNDQPRVMYAAIVDGIVTVDVRVADARRDWTVTIYDAEGVEVCSVTDSVASYLSRLDANNTDVANALIKLSDSALAYFHPNKVTASYTAYQGSGYLVVPEGASYLKDITASEVVDHDSALNIVGLRIGGVSDDNVNDGHPFYNGFIITPRGNAVSEGKTDAYVVYDLTGMDVDTFYAAVGITNKNGQYMDYNESTGGYGGVICEVWGKAGDGEYELLAKSDVIIKTGTGEFTVDIEGYDMIKLVSRANDPRTNASTDTGWGDACVYKSK